MLREVAGLCGVGMRNELIPAGSGAVALSPPCSLGTGWNTPRTSSRAAHGPQGSWVYGFPPFPTWLSRGTAQTPTQQRQNGLGFVPPPRAAPRQRKELKLYNKFMQN